MLIDSLK